MLVIIILPACYSNNDSIKGIAHEWIDCSLSTPNDIVSINHCDSNYIIVYIDSIKCIACDLQLNEWSNVKTNLQLRSQKSWELIVLVNSQRIDEIKSYVENENSDIVVKVAPNIGSHIKIGNSQLDKFSSICLTISKGKVVSVDDPRNALYYHHDIDPQTELSLSQKEIDCGDIKVDSIITNRIYIKNTGKEPLHIYKIITSCECVNVAYDNRLVSSQDSIAIYISFSDSIKGEFYRTTSIYTNVPNSPIEIEMFGKIY